MDRDIYREWVRQRVERARTIAQAGGIEPALASGALRRRASVSLRANVLCMGAWIVGPYVARDMADAWLKAVVGEGFNEERRRVQADGYARIQGIEAENFK